MQAPVTQYRVPSMIFVSCVHVKSSVRSLKELVYQKLRDEKKKFDEDGAIFLICKKIV